MGCAYVNEDVNARVYLVLSLRQSISLGVCECISACKFMSVISVR